MNNFTVSALKYRPGTFTSVVGQSSITATLKNAILNNHLAHAYLFCGPRGVGKTTCARIFAKTLNCLNSTNEAEACNECESCNAFNQDRSFNIHELDAASNSSVENIRSLIDQVRIPPQIGKYSLYIIDEVHMLSSNAFNAFLKTLEEPPSHAVFILATTEKHKIIPTILSRCQIFDFHRIGITNIIEHLQFVAKQENVIAEEEGLNIIAQKADGSMRDALSIFDQIVSFTGKEVSYMHVIDNLNVLDYEYYFKLTDNFLQSSYADVLLIFNEILSKGFDGHNFINGLAKHLRDLLVCKDVKTVDLLDAGIKLKEKYDIQAKKCSIEFIFRALKICNTCDINYKTSKNGRLHVEIALFELCNLSGVKKKVIDKAVSVVPENSKLKISDNTKPAESSKEYSTNKNENSEEDLKEAKTQVVKETQSVENTAPEKKLLSKTENQKSISVKEAYKLVENGSSINEPAIEKDFEKDENILEDDNGEELTNEFSIENLIEAWTKFTEKYKEEKRLFAVLTADKPILSEDLMVSYSLKNATQENEIRDIKSKLLIHLKQELKNTKIQLLFKLEESTENDDGKKRLYTDQDKFRYMNEKNPNLEELRQKLNLDFT